MATTRIREADVAEEIAQMLHKANVQNPHPYTIEHAERYIRLELLRQTLTWYRYILGE